MESRVTRPLVVAAGSVVALAGLLVGAYFVEPLARLDATALHGLRTLSEQHPWIWTISDGFAHSVDLPYLAAMLLLICAAGLAWGRPRQVAAAVALVGIANVLTQLLKVAAAHPRFQPFLGSAQLADAAFPSGHATAAMSLALAAVIVAPARWRRVTALGGGGFALAVSIALVIQGWHFPSDVLGAFLVTGLVSMLVLAGLGAIEARAPASGSVRPPLALRSIGALALQLLAVAVAIGVMLLVISQPGAVTAYAAAHTTAVAAAIGIAVASFGLVSGVTAELETR